MAGESLKRFKERHTRVPLQGLIRNNHLVFRPTSSGKLEITSDEPPFEYKIPPNRGIQTEVARERLESLTTWLSSGERAPRPDWEQLDNKQFELTKPNLDEQDEHRDPIELDFRFQALELTEHQLAMLQPPETRIKSLVYSQFIQRRGRKKSEAEQVVEQAFEAVHRQGNQDVAKQAGQVWREAPYRDGRPQGEACRQGQGRLRQQEDQQEEGHREEGCRRTRGRSHRGS